MKQKQNHAVHTANSSFIPRDKGGGVMVPWPVSKTSTGGCEMHLEQQVGKWGGTMRKGRAWLWAPPL